MSKKNENATYPYKYGELKVLAQSLAEDVKINHHLRSKNESVPYLETIAYDKAKRVLQLLEEQGIR